MSNTTNLFKVTNNKSSIFALLPWGMHKPQVMNWKTENHASLSCILPSLNGCWVTDVLEVTQVACLLWINKYIIWLVFADVSVFCSIKAFLTWVGIRTSLRDTVENYAFMAFDFALGWRILNVTDKQLRSVGFQPWGLIRGEQYCGKISTGRGLDFLYTPPPSSISEPKC